MMTVLHVYLRFTQPLFVQAIMGLKAIYDAKPVALHVLGKPAEGDLSRPFKAAPGLFGSKCFYSSIPCVSPSVCRLRD
jgi:Phosphate transport (Pho88)